MSMKKGIQHGKEHRKPYTGSKAIDKTCRNHGGCEWCRENRQKKYIVKEQAMRQRMREHHDREAKDIGETEGIS